MVEGGFLKAPTVEIQSSVTHQTVASTVQVINQITPLPYLKCRRASCCIEDNIHTPDPGSSPCLSLQLHLPLLPPRWPSSSRTCPLAVARCSGPRLFPLALGLEYPACRLSPMAGFLSLRPPPCKEHPTHFHQTTPPVLLSQEGLLLSEIIVFVSLL